MPSTAEHINARGDVDLQARLVAMAEMQDIPNPAGWVMANMPQLITQPVDGDQTITSVHAYASNARDTYIAATPPPPGMNPGAVLDAHLLTAITTLHAEQTAPGE